MKKNLSIIGLVACLLITLYSGAGAQTSSNELSVALGNSTGLVKDEVFSPLNYQSSGGTLGLMYQRNTKKGHVLGLDLELKTLELKTSTSDHFIADQVQLNMELAYLIPISPNNSEKQEWLFGIDFHSNGNLINYEDPITLSSSGTYVSHRGLGLQLLQRNQFKKNRITLHAKLPIVGKVYRSPYNVFTKDMNDEQLITFLYSNGQFGSIHNYFNPSVSATISRPIIGRFFFTAGYEFDYLRSSVNQTITNYQGRLILAATFKF